MGDILGIEGVVFTTHTGELTVRVHHFTMLSKSLRPLPEKWHGLTDKEQRYRQRYLDLMVNPEVRTTFVKRAAMMAAIRKWYTDHGFSKSKPRFSSHSMAAQTQSHSPPISMHST